MSLPENELILRKGELRGKGNQTSIISVPGSRYTGTSQFWEPIQCLLSRIGFVILAEMTNGTIL